MPAALIDASALVAAFGTDQPKGQHYQSLFQSVAEQRWSLSTTWPCVTEASYMVAPPQRYTLLRWLGHGAISVYPFKQEELIDFADLMHRYTQAPRSEMDLADASLLWLAEQTGVTRIMTLDVRDFSRYRLPDGRAFEIL
jgi:predicted nucleic acid-binding protein